MGIEIDDRERDTIIAALRHWQETGKSGGGINPEIIDIATADREGDDAILSDDEINDLIEERINVDHSTTAHELLRELVAWNREAWEAETTLREPGCIEQDSCEINGGDTVEWLGEFRQRAKAYLDGQAQPKAADEAEKCPSCGEARDESANSTHQQWECCCCGSWNDRGDA